MKQPKSIFDFIKTYLPDISDKIMYYGTEVDPIAHQHITDGKFTDELSQMRFIKYYFVEALNNYRKAIENGESEEPKKPKGDMFDAFKDSDMYKNLLDIFNLKKN